MKNMYIVTMKQSGRNCREAISEDVLNRLAGLSEKGHQVILYTEKTLAELEDAANQAAACWDGVILQGGIELVNRDFLRISTDETENWKNAVKPLIRWEGQTYRTQRISL